MLGTLLGLIHIITIPLLFFLDVGWGMIWFLLNVCFLIGYNHDKKWFNITIYDLFSKKENK